VEVTVRFIRPGLARAGAAAAEGVARLRGRRPRLCRELVRTVIHGHAYDGSRAERELGLSYTPIRESLARTLAWYREHGLLGV
jgi:dihydroflavonol-4-reductase